jgi:two-component system sensor kinase
MSHQNKTTSKAFLREIKSYRHALQMVTYEIHDGFTQYATAALLHLGAVRRNMPHETDKAPKDFRAAMELLRLATFESRTLINGLRSSRLDEFDLKRALDTMLAKIKSGDKLEVEVCWQVCPDSLPPRLAHAAFRIIQECVTNAGKHSKSHRVRVRFTQKGTWLYLEVEDWGMGFVTKQIRHDCIGLEGIRLRARLLGGRVRIVSTSGQGTTVLAKLPIAHETRQNAPSPRARC